MNSITAEKIERFKKLWKAGLSEETIARILGVHKDKVQALAKSLGLSHKRKRLNKRRIDDETIELIRFLRLKGLPAAEIARSLDISYATVLKYLKIMGLSKPRKLRKITREELLDYVKKGLTDREIAELLGVSVQYVRILRGKFGIRRLSSREKALQEKDQIARILSEEGFSTNRELGKRGIKIDRRKIWRLKNYIDDLEFFKISRISTKKYRIFKNEALGLIVIYLKGFEDKVAAHLIELVEGHPPPLAIKFLLKYNSVPEGVIEEVMRKIPYLW